MQDWDSEQERLKRIQADISRNAQRRRKLIKASIERSVGGNRDWEISAIQRIGDSWLLSETELLNVFVANSDCESELTLRSRIRELESIDAAICRFLGTEVQTKIGWLRSPSSSLGGFRPIEYIQASRGDAGRVVMAIRKEKGV